MNAQSLPGARLYFVASASRPRIASGALGDVLFFSAFSAPLRDAFFISHTYNNAWSRSPTMSSTSSIPTDNLTNPSVIPIRSCTSFGMDAGVITAGNEISVSTPPRLSASEHNFT